MGRSMKVFESALTSADGTDYVIIRVPGTVFANTMESGRVRHLAELKYHRESLLLAVGTVQMAGSLNSCSHLLDFDEHKVKWVQWTMPG